MSTQQVPLANMMFQVKIAATAEARDAEGRLLNPDGSLATEGSTHLDAGGTETVTGAELAGRYNDDELRAAGLTDTQIADLRGSTEEQE